MTVTLVQTKAGNNGVTLDDAPTVGNTLLLWKSRDASAAPTLQTGFTDIATAINTAPTVDVRGRFMYRVVELGDDESVASDAMSQSNNRYVLMEWAGELVMTAAAIVTETQVGSGGANGIFEVVVAASAGTFTITYQAESDSEYTVPDLPFDIDADGLQGSLAAGAYTPTPSPGDYFAVTGTGTLMDPFVVEFINQYELQGAAMSSPSALYVSQDTVASTVDFDAGGAFTPVAGIECVIVGGGTIGNNADDDFSALGAIDPDSGVTEISDEWTGHLMSAWTGYRQVATASGSYTVGGTIDPDPTTFCGVTVALAPFEVAEGPGLWAEFDGEWERLPVMDWRVTRGVSGDLAGNASPGSGIFTIQNPDDRYNPYNEAGPLFGFLKDGVRLWCGVNDDGTLTDGGTVKGIFAGYANDWEPMPVSGASVSPTVVITGADPLEWMGRQPVRLADSRTRSQADVRIEVLTAIGWPYLTDLPAEPTTLPLSGFDGLAGNVLDALNRSSGTRHYIKPADTMSDFCTYTAVRRTSLLDAVSLASFDAGSDHVTAGGFRLSADGVINQQKASIEPIDFSALRDVWEADVLPTVLTGTPYVVWAEFADFVDAPLVDEAHTGSSLTTAIEPFGKTAKVTLTSSGTSVLTHLAVQGYAVVRAAASGYVADDTASQADRGVRAGPDITGDLAGTLTAAQGLADHIVYRFPEPLGRPTVTIVNKLPEQFERDLLQLVDMTVAELSITEKRYEIVGLTHTGEMAAPTAVSHTVDLVLQESREQTDPGWFILGDSLLGGDDILAY